MPDITIKDFRGGLDARKFKLSLPAGTLSLGDNGHINQGGEFEKRKAFTKSILPSNTFGQLPTSKGILVFGSRDVSWQLLSGLHSPNTGIVEAPRGASLVIPNVGDTIVISNCSDPNMNGTGVVNDSEAADTFIIFYADQNSYDQGSLVALSGTLSVQFPAPYLFQQLTHPDGVTQMTGVVSAALFNDKAFVVSTFSDGKTYEFYDGKLVEDFIAGLVAPYQDTPEQIAQEVFDLINATDNYTAALATDPKYLSFNIAGAPTGSSVSYAYLVPNFSLTNPADGDTVTIGTSIYTFRTAINNANVGEVLIGAKVDDSFFNLTQAINGGSGSGTLYSSATTANPSVTATWLPVFTSHFINVTAITPGAGGDSIAVSSNQVYLIWIDPTTSSSTTHLLFGYPSSVASGNISGSINFVANATVTVGTRVYTFVTNNPLPNAYQIKLQLNLASNLGLLQQAIGGNASGVNFSSGIVANSSASAALSGTTLTLTALALGAAGNSIALATSNGSLTVTAFSGGVDSSIEISSVYFNSDQLCGAIPYGNQSPSSFAASIAALINQNVTSGIAPAGYSATVSGSQVNIYPPNPIVPGTDALSVPATGSLVVNVPALAAQFNSFSTPTVNDGTPYQVSVTTKLQPGSTGGFSVILNNTGIASVPAVQSVGSFSITAGTNNTQATGTLTDSTNAKPTNGDTVTIGAVQYTFATTLTAGTANQIKIGSNGDNSLQNLIFAINGTGTPGTNYSDATVKNLQVVAGALSAHAFVITAIVGGSVGNLIATTAVSTGPVMAWGAATLTGGDASDTNQIVQVAIGSNPATNLLTGYVAFNQSVSQTALDVAAAINANTATGFTATANNGTISIFSPVANSQSYNSKNIHVTAAGNVCIAQCFFTVNAATANSGAITSIVLGGSGNVLTGSTAITFQDAGHSTETLSQFVARVAVAVNATSGSLGYVACAIGQNLYLSPAASNSNDTVPLVTITTSGTISLTGGTLGATSVVLSSYSITIPIKTTSFTKTGGTSATDTATASGGNPPYTYSWQYAGTGASIVKAISPTSVSTAFTIKSSSLPSNAVIEPWVCVVKDSSIPQNVVTSAIVNIYVPGGF